MRPTLIALILLVTGSISSTFAQGAGYSLRFYGNGRGDIDRVKIQIDNPERAVDVGGNFTIEFFMRAPVGANGSGSCSTGNSTWIAGNTIIDRDVFGGGDYGDYGISLFGDSGVIAFGVSRGGSGQTLCGSTNVADNNWHHIAVTRNSSSGQLRLFVDGVPDGTATGPTGDVSYRNGRSTGFPNDPFLVIGAEKHDAGASFPSYSGWIDELRISNNIRYSAAFTPPSAPFSPDANTVGLYHFNEGTGNTVGDSSGTDSHGVRRFGGSPAGPVWSTETPFSGTSPTLGAPTLLAPANGAITNDNTPAFSWNAVTSAEAYNIVVDNQSDFSSPAVNSQVNALSFTSGTLADNLYYWRVRGVSGANSGAWSSTRTFTIDTQPPGVPTLLTPPNAAETSNRTINLTWQAQDDAAQYQVRLDTVTPPAQIVYTGSAPQFSYTSPVQVTTYYWQVRAIDAAGNSSNWSGIRSIRLQSPLNAAPQRNYFTTSTPRLTWGVNTAAVAYQVEVDNQMNFSSPEFRSAELSPQTLGITTTPLVNGTYYWRVRAKQANGRWGNWSRPESFVVNVP